jgi:hypothetical protein
MHFRGVKTLLYPSRSDVPTPGRRIRSGRKHDKIAQTRRPLNWATCPLKPHRVAVSRRPGTEARPRRKNTHRETERKN